MVAIEVEAIPPRGGLLWFPPLQTTVRGQIDIKECPEADAALYRLWSEVIPGQRVGITAQGVGYITDPLHEPAYQALRAKVLAQHMTLPPARQEFPGVDVPTWQWWLKRLVDSGLARVVSGALPEKVEGRVRKRFIGPEHEESPEAGRIKRLEAQNASLVKLLVSRMSAAERRAFEDAQAGGET